MMKNKYNNKYSFIQMISFYLEINIYQKKKFNFILSSQLMVIVRLIHIHKHEF